MVCMNLVQKAVSEGGILAPIVIPEGLTSGTGLMNPSIFIDSHGDILVNLRHVNYALYHSESQQMFPSPWGPVSYLHPESDMRLVTENYLCRLNPELKVVNYTKVEMKNLHDPIWEFHGLEDCRLVEWGGRYYLVGVRRDTTENGEGRMEYSEIDIDKRTWTAQEVHRKRIPAPNPNNSYCEKNWVPVLDRPYTFVKWSSPTEVVYSHPNADGTQPLSLTQGATFDKDQRGGSQVVKWGEYFIAITHETSLWKNYLGQKDALYRHRVLVWDSSFNLLGGSNPFSFLNGNIEFCTGAAKLDEDLLISFGFQDNAAFVLRTPGKVIEQLIEEALNVK